MEEKNQTESVDLGKLAKDSSTSRPDIAFDSSNGNEEQSKSVVLNRKILRDCEKSRGYLVFAARLSKDKDEDGNHVIESTINTLNFPSENLVAMPKVFKKHIANCIVDML